MLGGYTIGYLYYVIALYIASGLLIIYIDVRNFKNAKKLKKEWKVSRFIGWFNIIVGILIWTGNLML